MKKTVITLSIVAALVLSLAGCGLARPAVSQTPAVAEQNVSGETAEVQIEPAATPAPAPAAVRQDGERFEEVIILEGMEETVHYEHVRNEALGLEMDYVPGMLEDFSPLIEQGGLEYTIGSIHLIPAEGAAARSDDDLWMIDGSRYQTYDEGLMRHYGGDIRRGVRAYFHNENAMLERNHPTVVGHPDKIVMHNRDRYFHEDEPWYRDLALETIHLIKELDLICEINTRGIYKGRHADYYPGKWLIQEMKTLKIPVIVSTDAHAPEDLLRTEGAYEYLSAIGYPEVLQTLPV